MTKLLEDKLKKLEVDVGSEELLKIVTNASNVKEPAKDIVSLIHSHRLIQGSLPKLELDVLHCATVSFYQK